MQLPQKRLPRRAPKQAMYTHTRREQQITLLGHAEHLAQNVKYTGRILGSGKVLVLDELCPPLLGRNPLRAVMNGFLHSINELLKGCRAPLQPPSCS